MDEKIAEYFAAVITTAAGIFENCAHEQDCTPERAILQLHGEYGSCKILITELFSDKLRKYRYYVLQGNRVEAGFDNAPDPRAIRMKYGKIGKEHAGENIPHLHLDDKTSMVLTEEMMFSDFVEWLQGNRLQTE
ncbi:hypothetical protein VU08_01125 [Desulfobulbus sp. F5]|nr:hypothetical protein [Desulfobulbus sp. F5]